MVYVGAHLSTGKGWEKTVAKALELGATCFQYFPKNPKSNRPKTVDWEAGRAAAELAAAHGILTLAHSPYVTNLSSSDPALHEKTVTSVANDLALAEAFGTPYVVVHCGKHLGEGEEQGEARMAATIDEILSAYSGPTLLLLENTAGQGTELGQSPAELMRIRGLLAEPKRVGFCLDTCHAFAAGVVDWSDEGSYDAFEQELRATGMLPLVRAIHFNDSMMELGGRRDRHEKLLKGYIGEEGLRRAATTPTLVDIPLFLETPVENEEEYGPEIALLQRWRREAGAA